VVGGLDRLWSATAGGFAVGFATGGVIMEMQPVNSPTQGVESRAER